MTEIIGKKFSGSDPFVIARRWLDEAREYEPNDPNAAALATAAPSGCPNVRMVLIKSIESDSFVFYTNYGSVKAQEIEASGRAAFVLHWKTLRRQIRARGMVEKFSGTKADEYFESRSLQSKLGAWASRQSQPLKSKQILVAEAARMGVRFGTNPPRPEFWGGYRISPLEIEFWADGKFRLHDRLRWTRSNLHEAWQVKRLYP
ncbi:MAG: pyridoxamine 5'-phosphate oxidase [Albidovulum sp.]|nr:pyridoxamine 5'-phosphate oxidase [Albidovulum sp.]